MPDSLITNLGELTTIADNDYYVVVDISDTSQSASGTTKKIQRHNSAKLPVITLSTPEAGLLEYDGTDLYITL